MLARTGAMAYNGCGVKSMISENLLTLRKRSGYSQEYVAEQVGVSRQAVAKWESGDTVPDLNNSMALSRLYDVSLDDLVNYASDAVLPLPPRGKHFFGAVTVGEKGQIVIPVKARKLFGIKAGDSLVVLGDEGRGLALLKQEELLDLITRMQKGETT